MSLTTSFGKASRSAFEEPTQWTGLSGWAEAGFTMPKEYIYIGILIKRKRQLPPLV
jgi:hypothetical protein